MSVNTKMTALANEIRELSGTTTSKGIDAMTSDINDANTEIAEQAELLAQIMTALEDKMGDNKYGEVPENVTDFYTFTNSGLGYALGLNSDFYTAIDEETDYIKDGETLWKVGDPLPNPGSTYEGKPVIDMKFLFEACRATTLDLSEWDTSNVTNMEGIFAACGRLGLINISNFDTSKVTNMSNMFSGCGSLTTLNISNFNTSNVTDMSYMFQDCSLLTTLDVSNFDTSNVNFMNGMFFECSELTSLDLSNFNTSNVTDMSYMFRYCSKLTKIQARTEADKTKFESSSDFPSGCTVTVKDQASGGSGSTTDYNTLYITNTIPTDDMGVDGDVCIVKEAIE